MFAAEATFSSVLSTEYLKYLSNICRVIYVFLPVILFFTCW